MSKTVFHRQTNINWQIGHILVSKFFHGIRSVSKFKDEVLLDLPLKQYSQRYGYGSQPMDALKDKPGKQRLLAGLSVVDDAAFTVLEQFAPEDLDLPTRVPNPVAKTRYEALIFSFEHQMWHNGQIALIKRVVIG